MGLVCSSRSHTSRHADARRTGGTAPAFVGRRFVDGDVVRAVAQGADASWLEAAGFDAAVVSLLIRRRIPPVEPPADWPLALDPLLARACGESEFWQRFGGHLCFDA